MSRDLKEVRVRARWAAAGRTNKAKGNSRCEHPRTGPSLGSLRNSKEAVARAE